MQHITIKNFGPLADVDIDLPDVILLIGAQASGKSTLAKLVFYFRSLRNDLIEILNDDVVVASDVNFEFFKRIRHKFSPVFFGTTKHITKPFSIKFKFGEGKYLYVNHTDPNHGVVLGFSSNPDLELDKTNIRTNRDIKAYFNLLKQIKDYKTKFIFNKPNSAIMNTGERKDWEREKRTEKAAMEGAINMFFENDRDATYIPASRTTLAILPDILGAADNLENLDELFRFFLQRVNILRPSFRNTLNDLIAAKRERMNGSANQRALSFAEKSIPIIQEKILKGRYEHSDFMDWIVLEDGSRIKFNLASSGQQEATWITLQLFVSILNADKTFTVIEEPEAHLYPIAQLEMVKIIALLSNVLTGNDANQVMITTHSPYILTALNLLLYAHKVGQQQPEKVDKMVAKEFWLDKNRVAAYEVKGGKLENILDSDLLHADRIDTASEKINLLFDKLLNMDEL